MRVWELGGSALLIRACGVWVRRVCRRRCEAPNPPLTSSTADETTSFMDAEVNRAVHPKPYVAYP